MALRNQSTSTPSAPWVPQTILAALLSLSILLLTLTGCGYLSAQVKRQALVVADAAHEQILTSMLERANRNYRKLKERVPCAR